MIDMGNHLKSRHEKQKIPTDIRLVKETNISFNHKKLLDKF